MEPTRVGIVGAGFAARSHIDALRRVPGVDLTGITASSPERSRAAAEELGVPAAFGSVADMVASPNVDAIHNCAPNHLHLEINRSVLAAGKHLLSEKPLGLTSVETGELEALASEAGVVTGVCHNYRHFPLVRHAKELLDSGELGAPHFVHGTYLQDWLAYAEDWNWRLEANQSGGSRAVADIGSHWFDLIQYVTGMKVVRVSARKFALHLERLKPTGEVQTFQRAEDAPADAVRIDTEDGAVILLEFDTGVLGTLSVSQVSPGRKNDLVINVDTPSAGLAWRQEDPNRLWIGRRDEANAQLFRDPGLLSAPAARLAHYPGGHEEGWPDALKNLIDDFYAAVRGHDDGSGHEASFATFSDAHHVTLVVEAVMASAASERWVDVDEGAKP